MKKTVTTFAKAKQSGEKLTMLTAYDYSTAKLMDESGVDAILVGDSLGNVILGYDSTVAVTMEDMIHHGAAVARGAKEAMVVVDMPFMSYQTSVYDALVNAGRLMKEANAGAVKLEGGESVCEAIKAITQAGIPVMAHLGLTPQSVNAFGGFKVQCKDELSAKKLVKDALAVQEAGAFAVVLECVPANLRNMLQVFSIFRLSVSVQAQAVTVRCLYIRICSECSATIHRNLLRNMQMPVHLCDRHLSII